NAVRGAEREADRAGAVRDTARDGLADPPGGVRREPEAVAPLELVDGAQQTEISFLNQVEEADAGPAVTRGHGDDEAQVRLHEGAAGGVAFPHPAPQLTATVAIRASSPLELSACLVAGLDALREPDLVGLPEQPVPTDLGEIHLQEVVGVGKGAPSS